VAALRAAGGELTASLRDASIPLGQLSFGTGGASSGAGQGGSGQPRGQADPRGGVAPEGAPQPAVSARRVRLVM
jgi:hypothetical protein